MRFLAICIVASLCLASTAWAQGPVFESPKLDPNSGSYFELVRVTKQQAPGKYIPELSFDEAARAAAGRSFKGVRGRLAIIRSHATHMFIMQNLRPPTYTWIGLRYLCKLRQLRWINGDIYKRGQFQAWHRQWDQSQNAGCVNGGGEADWMPVAMSGAEEGMRWVAKGARKHYIMYLVEYPVGKASNAKSSAD